MSVYRIIEKIVITIAFTSFVYFLLREIHKNKFKYKWWLRTWKEKDYEHLDWILKNKWVFVIFAVLMILLLILTRS